MQVKKILVLYYSQTGQLKKIIDNITEPLKRDDKFEVDYLSYTPVKDFPYPWPSDQFFDAMPESVNCVPCEMNPLYIDKSKDYDLIIFAYQIWYLSPAIPANSILETSQIKELFYGKEVITVLGVRNMWVMGHEIVRNKLLALGANQIGNIVLEDQNNNLISVLTIIKWLIHGEKGPYKFLPEAGVSQKNINESVRFGEIIKSWFNNSFDENLQKKLVEARAVRINYPIYQMEKNARRIFRIWAGIIQKKGIPGNTSRLPYIRIFKYYLIFMIFVISPLAGFVFKTKQLLFSATAKREMKYYLNLE